MEGSWGWGVGVVGGGEGGCTVVPQGSLTIFLSMLSSNRLPSMYITELVRTHISISYVIGQSILMVSTCGHTKINTG